MRVRFQAVTGLFFGLVMMLALPVGAADRGKLAAFLQVTGFDVALDSIALSASGAPEMLGLNTADFGQGWKRVADQVFDTEKMRTMALDILELALSDELLDHAAAFYASPLGVRLVAAENAAHMEPDDDAKRDKGSVLLADLVAQGSPRVGYLRRMNEAIDASGSAVRAVQEIQIRFLMAASDAGVLGVELDEAGLRAVMKGNESELRTRLALSSMASSAQAYRDFSDAEVLAYTEALEDARMVQVYELMNAIEWEIMANRFEALAGRMAGIQPGEDL